MMPFDPAAAPTPSVEASPRSGRAPERTGRTRGRRGGGEPRPAPEAAAAPAETAAPPRAGEPARQHERAPRERQDRGHERGSRARSDRPPERPAPDRAQPDRRPHGRDRDDGDDGVVGFGRDVPAFLSKPPPARSDD